jgi:hypothetical protein
MIMIKRSSGNGQTPLRSELYIFYSRPVCKLDVILHFPYLTLADVIACGVQTGRASGSNDANLG